MMIFRRQPSLVPLLGWSLAVVSAAAILLAVALAVKATAAPPIIVVPGATGSLTVRPGDVPEALVRDTAFAFVGELDNYLPSTIEASTELLKKRFSARFANEAARMLDGRKKLVLESRMSSQVVAREPEEAGVRATLEGYEVTFVATRRIWVADKLTQEGEVLYRIVFDSALPSAACPHGLSVTALGATLDPKAKTAAKGAARNEVPDDPKR